MELKLTKKESLLKFLETGDYGYIRYENYAPPEINHVPIVKQPKIGRNDDCPCGSGKKYKKCCGKA